MLGFVFLGFRVWSLCWVFVFFGLQLFHVGLILIWLLWSCGLKHMCMFLLSFF